ncbi:hypothetical protein P7C73_g5645, partial [Tremellales sp. Uapishka_1]
MSSVLATLASIGMAVGAPDPIPAPHPVTAAPPLALPPLFPLLLGIICPIVTSSLGRPQRARSRVSICDSTSGIVKVIFGEEAPL